MNYFGHSHSYAELFKLDQWIRRRVRLCYWKDWQRPRTRRQRLMALGLSICFIRRCIHRVYQKTMDRHPRHSRRIRLSGIG